uniref:Wsv133-like protein n=1 Tax=Metapenaeus ensis majanivirus TaxID=2984279 RepID=A0A9C7CDP8_9VIRU|nr:MAG: wsv133-like protein [Metapenaeus ensis majanivirus]
MTTSFKEYTKLLDGIKLDLLSDPIFQTPQYNKEKQFLIQLAEEAALVSFVSEIGLCTNHTLVALNSRLQKQGTTNISLQLGSHINARFEGIKQDVLTNDQYMILFDKNDTKFDWNVSSQGSSVSDGQRRTRQALWDQLVQRKTKDTQLLIFSVVASPLRYKNEKLIGSKDDDKERNKEEEEKDKIFFNNAETNWTLFEKCQCVARINEKLDNREKL